MKAGNSILTPNARMKIGMDRKQAIEIIATEELKGLTFDERDTQIYVMSAEDWSGIEGWNELLLEIRNELCSEDFQYDANDTRYDCLLLLWIKDDLRAATNDFIIGKLSRLNISVTGLIGDPIELYPCPCCGYRTLDEPSVFDICTVCWWEDDGQDNEDADDASGGPNYGISLTKARYNFLANGIYDPKRTDLVEKQNPKEKYIQARFFSIKDEKTIIEDNVGWSGKVA